MFIVTAEIEIQEKGTHTERFEVSSMENAEKEVRGMVDQFNEALKNGESPRHFVKIVTGTGKILHTWKKSNLVTLKDGNGLYDLYVCETCLKKHKRRYLAEKLPREECRGGI
ncbi:MAG: hypothetical protein WBA22_14335 [Candidatus Methanofastidiosia archaeon]